MQPHTAWAVDVWQRATEAVHPAALAAVLALFILMVAYAAIRCTVLAWRWVTRGYEPPPRKVYVCHTVSPAAAEAMKEWASKLQ